VRHLGGASSGGKSSAFAEYYGARNRLWTLARNMPLWLMPIALPAHILIMAYVLLRSPRLLRIRLRAVGAAFRNRDLFRAPSLPKRGSQLAVARSLCWSPVALSRRSVVVRAVKS
jgi:hypothetical protein